MHPRSAADILASVKPTPKRSRKPAKTNPLTSDPRFTRFSVAAMPSTSAPDSTPVLFPNISIETDTPGSYVPLANATQSTYKFISASMPNTVSTERGEEGVEDIADSGHFEEFNSMSALPMFILSLTSTVFYLYCSSTPLEIFDSDSSSSDRDSGSLKAPPIKAFKSRAQRFEDVLGILREGRLSPFDLMVELLDDSNLKYWAYRNELYKGENKKLSEILELIFSNAPGKEKLMDWMLPHALEVICSKVSDEMDVVQEAERLPGLDAITPEFIKAWHVSGNQENAPFLFEILLTAAETASAKEKNKKKSPLAVSRAIYFSPKINC